MSRTSRNHSRFLNPNFIRSMFVRFLLFVDFADCGVVVITEITTWIAKTVLRLHKSSWTSMWNSYWRLDTSMNEILAMDKLNSRNQLDSKKFSWCSGYHNLDSQDSLHLEHLGGLISRWMKFLQFRESGFTVSSGVIGGYAQDIVSHSSVRHRVFFLFDATKLNFLLNLEFLFLILKSENPSSAVFGPERVPGACRRTSLWDQLILSRLYKSV